MKRQEQDEKIYTEGIAPRGKTLKWLDNFWYHHKWVTIGVAFFLVVAIICTVQMCTKEKNDIILVYAGRNQLSVEQTEKISQALSAVCPEDFDGDGKKNIALSHYCIMSETQIREIEAQTDEAGHAGFVDKSYISSQRDTYDNYIQTGDVSVLLLDKELYESLLANNRLEKLSDVLGYNPENAMSEYGVCLGDTALYDEFGVMKYIPEDTVVCILRPYVFGKNSKEEHFENEKKMFSAIVRDKT